MTDAYMKRAGFAIERTFDAPVARVWRAWTEPEDLARWIWAGLGRDGWAEADVRVGGAYRVYTQHPGGRHRGEGWSGMCGLYVAVEPERRLVMTVHWDADVGYNRPEALTLDEILLVAFEAQGEQTRLTLQHLGIPDDGKSALAHHQGVAESLDLLALLLTA